MSGLSTGVLAGGVPYMAMGHGPPLVLVEGLTPTHEVPPQRPRATQNQHSCANPKQCSQKLRQRPREALVDLICHKDNGCASERNEHWWRAPDTGCPAAHHHGDSRRQHPLAAHSLDDLCANRPPFRRYGALSPGVVVDNHWTLNKSHRVRCQARELRFKHQPDNGGLPGAAPPASPSPPPSSGPDGPRLPTRPKGGRDDRCA
jgi:hypothetical protein